MSSVAILNVGEGDTKLSFDKANPAERIRAARIVKDMLRRGYALLVEDKDGKYVRALDFDEAKCEYIIADLDPEAARAADEAEHDETGTQAPQDGAAPTGKAGRSKSRLKRKFLAAEEHKGVAVGRIAGG